MALNGEASGSGAKRRLTREKMIEYLQSPDNFDCIVKIHHPKVAQKSYGTEKRFFCPPPYIVFTGNGWKRHEEQLRQNGFSAELQATIGIAKPTEQKEASLQFNNEHDQFETKWDVRSLFISDSDKRKYISLTLNSFYNCCSATNSLMMSRIDDVGTFDSKRIKVISKPSKKKQSMKAPDTKNQGIGIASGTQIALFNRARSQSANTRYLYVEGGKFTANQKRWGTFTIHLIDEEDDFSNIGPSGHFAKEDYFSMDGYINYGSIVKLVDSVTGIALPQMRILKVENNLISFRTAQEPVSQLHKCVFEMRDNRNNFLCFSNENIIQQQEPDGPYNGKHISDAAQWTICSTDTTEYRFYEATGLVEKVTPIPTITSITMEASETHHAYLEISGANFTPALTVWVNATEVRATAYISPERICCPLPQLQTILSDESSFLTNGHADSWLQQQNQLSSDREFKVCLVRDDGVIYASTAAIKYPVRSDRKFEN